MYWPFEACSPCTGGCLRKAVLEARPLHLKARAAAGASSLGAARKGRDLSLSGRGWFRVVKILSYWHRGKLLRLENRICVLV